MKTDRSLAGSCDRGFSLVELMIVVVIVAILAAIALPNYTRYSQRTRRLDGQQLLLRIAIAEERFYTANNRYGTAAEVGYAASPLYSEKGYYTVAVTTTNLSGNLVKQAFSAVATPTGAQAADTCGALTLTQTGAKTSAGTTTNGRCW